MCEREINHYGLDAEPRFSDTEALIYKLSQKIPRDNYV